MSGFLQSLADRWVDSHPLNALVPVDRMFTGRVPTTEQYPMPYVSVIQGGGYHSYRSDKTDSFRVPVSFHVWVNDSDLRTGEQIEEAIRRCFASTCWQYESGKVRDVIDEGPGNKRQVNEPNYKAWEIVKVFTFCLEQSRVDTGACCGSSSSFSSESH